MVNPTLSALFPDASQDTADLNPQFVTPAKPKKTRSGGIGGGWEDHYEANHQRPISDSEPQPNKTPALGSAVQGKTKSLCRVRVRFTGYRVRPLDPDNFAGSCKDLLDGLRHAGLLLGDEPWRIIYETEQEKVKSYANEKTIIEIEYP